MLGSPLLFLVPEIWYFAFKLISHHLVTFIGLTYHYSWRCFLFYPLQKGLFQLLIMLPPTLGTQHCFGCGNVLSAGKAWRGCISFLHAGLIKYKSNVLRKAPGDVISRPTDATQCNKMKGTNEPLLNKSSAASSLTSVRKLCKVLGDSTEDVKDACKKLFDHIDCFGPHSIFCSVTPDHECNFCMCSYTKQGNKIKLPTSYCMDAECMQDFELYHWKKLVSLERVPLTTKLICKQSVIC